MATRKRTTAKAATPKAKAKQAIAKAKADANGAIKAKADANGSYHFHIVSNNAVYDTISHQTAMSKGDGILGGWSLGCKFVSGYFEYKALSTGTVEVTFPNKGNKALLLKLTGGAVPSNHHVKTKGYFGRDGQLTKDGQDWIRDRINGRGEFKTNLKQFEDCVNAITSAKPSKVDVVSIADDNHKGTVSVSTKLDWKPRG